MADPNYGMNAQRAAPPPARPVNPSCFGTLEDALSACSEVGARVERLVDRMCGAVPSPEGKTAGLDSNGLFNTATSQAIAIREHMVRINEALSRLESQLP